MRWQRTARIAIAIAVVVFTLIVFVALRRNRPVTPADDSPRTDIAATTESTGPIRFDRPNKEGKIIFSLAAEGHRTYANGRSIFLKPTLTLPDRGGRTIQMRADEMEARLRSDKLSEIEAAKMIGNFRINSSDGLEVTSKEATFDARDETTRIPGDVQFTRGRLKGSGVGATYDQRRDVLWLLKDARVSVTADEKGEGAGEGSADAAGFARAEHYLRLTGKGRMVGDNRTVEADDITIQLSEDEKRIRSMQLRGNSRITGTGPASQNMSARDIDLTYAEDGRALQHATLVENASVQLPGAEGAPGRNISGRNMTIALAPDGATVTSLTAKERAQVDLPAQGEQPARRITAAALSASGVPPAGLQTATFTGSVEFRETRPAGRGAPAAERVARSQRLVVETKPGLGDIQQADFRGNVRFEDGKTTGEAARGLYRIADDSLQLSPSPGDPGPPPRLTEERMTVDAGTITVGLQSKKLTAQGNVRSSLQPAAKGDGRAGAKGRGSGGDDKSRLPSMLKSDESVFVHSEALEYDGTSNAVYTGEARLFQGQTTVAGDTITLDDRNGNMTAEGNVRTVMFFDDVDPKTKVKKTTQTVGTAHRLVYQDDKRLATYTTGDTASAHIVGPQGDVTAETIDLYLKPKENELERAEADKKVTVKEGLRTAQGDHLTYTAADETYVMNGNPLHVDRRAPGECTRTMGVTLRFRRGDDTIIVDGIPGVTPFNTKPIPCQD
jgi:lipopolysaccharide export system protein LptA